LGKSSQRPRQALFLQFSAATRLPPGRGLTPKWGKYSLPLELLCHHRRRPQGAARPWPPSGICSRATSSVSGSVERPDQGFAREHPVPQFGTDQPVRSAAAIARRREPARRPDRP